jgi:hypothetical protein
LEVERRKLGAESGVTLEQMYNLSLIFEETGRDQDAEKLLRETLEHQKHVYGMNNSVIALSIYTLAGWAARRGDREKALALLREAIENKLDAEIMKGIFKDNNLKSLRNDPRFVAVSPDADQRSAVQQKPK